MESVTTLGDNSRAFFDYYAATIRDDLDTILGTLGEGCGREAVHVGAGLHGYKHMHEIRGAFGVEVRVLSGGSNGFPHAYASGDDARDFSSVVRSVWGVRGQHSVSRMDSRFDFTGDQCWAQLYEKCRQLAVSRKLRTDQQGDWLQGKHGRTFYIGGRQSAVRLRLYEKGIQMRDQYELQGREVDENWVRLELQVRPGKEAKWAAATATPEEAWGYSEWSQELLRQVAELDVERTPTNVWRQTDDQRALRWLAFQYGGALERLRAGLGDWASVGRVIGELIEERNSEGLGAFLPPAPRVRQLAADDELAVDEVTIGGVVHLVPRQLPEQTDAERWNETHGL